jgi:predicted ester cyclase
MTEPTQNAELIRRLYERAFNGSDLRFADEVHGRGYRYHDTTVPDAAEDHESYMARTAGFMDAFPDVEVSVEDVFGCGDRVTGRTVMRATHTRALGDLPPTGRRVQLASTIIYRFEEGRVVEEWEIFDKLGMYQQLGIAPPESDDW